MPRIFDQTTVIIQSGGGGSANVEWGPDYGDPSDGISITTRVSTDLEALGLGSNLTVSGLVTLFSTITGNLNLTAIGEVAAIFNAIFPTITTSGQVSYTAATVFSLLTAIGTITGVLRPGYTITTQGLADLEAIALNYPAKLTAQGQVATTETLTYDLLTVLGTVDSPYAIGLNNTRTCECLFDLETLALAHTKTCTCAVTATESLVYDLLIALGSITGNLKPTYTATCQGLYDLEALALAHTRSCTCTARATAIKLTYPAKHTCQGSIANLIYVLDYVNAATDTDKTITAPPGVTSLFSEVWSGGGGGASTATINGGGGGGGGGYANDTQSIAANDVITVRIGSGGAIGGQGGASYVQRPAGTDLARVAGAGAGQDGSAGGQGAGGTRGDATVGDVLRDGGLGGGGGGVQPNGGGGGGGSGTTGGGGDGGSNQTNGLAGTGFGGGAGGIGAEVVGDNSTAGSIRGGGGGGRSTTLPSSVGAKGGVRIQFTIPTP